MFEDFKYEIRRRNSEKAEPQPLSPEVIAKLQSQGLDPETVTMKQLFPEVLDEEGNDISLMSGAEWEIMIAYAKTRKHLLEKYPQSQQEARMLGQARNNQMQSRETRETKTIQNLPQTNRHAHEAPKNQRVYIRTLKPRRTPMEIRPTKNKAC
jgi:hypothetical protein